jgi:hypothetical protein
VARGLAEKLGLEEAFEFDSAGTHGYHVGDTPDPRTVAAARRRGYDLAHAAGAARDGVRLHPLRPRAWPWGATTWNGCSAPARR